MNTEIGKHSAFVDARAGPWCLGRRVARRFLGGFVGLPGRPAWRAVVLIVVCVLLSFPAWAEQNDLEPVEEQAEESESIARISCRDELDRPESWLDRSHSYLSRRLCEPAAWFDGFFGDPRAFEETPVGTFFRLRNSLQWDETEGFGFRVRVRANILLPRVSERVRLLITRDEDISGDFQDDPDRFDDDRTRLGLRFIASGNRRSQFDIDGTILRTNGVGMQAMHDVAERLYGPEFTWDGIVSSGHLDTLIFAEAAVINEIEHTEEAHRTFRDSYVAQLRDNLQAHADKVEVMPGVIEAIDRIRRRIASQGDVKLGLLTGNYAKAVPVKLEAVGVDVNWFEVTAFADDGATRADLVAVAIAKFEGLIGMQADRLRVIVIGDTPRDVACAKAHGCVAYTVCTGAYELEVLREAGADYAVPDLSDPSQLLALAD